MARKTIEPRYLGDGVYAHDIGHAVELAVKYHTNKVIVLDDMVLEQLIQFAKDAKLLNE